MFFVVLYHSYFTYWHPHPLARSPYKIVCDANEVKLKQFISTYFILSLTTLCHYALIYALFQTIFLCLWLFPFPCCSNTHQAMVFSVTKMTQNIRALFVLNIIAKIHKYADKIAPTEAFCDWLPHVCHIVILYTGRMETASLYAVLTLDKTGEWCLSLLDSCILFLFQPKPMASQVDAIY